VHKVPLHVGAALDSAFAQTVDDHGHGSHPQVSVGELIKLGPALWDVVAPLLDDGMEPGEHKHGLGAVDKAALL